MAKLPKKAAKEIELEPDAWPRFERFIVKAAKTPPHHRSVPKARKAKKRSK